MGSLDYDFIFKVVAIGDKYVGKTSLLVRYCEDQFTANTRATIGVDFLVKDLQVQSKKVKLELWDTGGEERFRAVTPQFYRQADAVLLVFDISRRETFESVTGWLQEIRKHCKQDVNVLLIANKSDLVPNIDEEEIQNFVDLHMLYWAETSAKKASNIDETFRRMANDLVLRHEQLRSLPSLDSGPGSLVINSENQNPNQGYCCSYL